MNNAKRGLDNLNSVVEARSGKADNSASDGSFVETEAGRRVWVNKSFLEIPKSEQRRMLERLEKIGVKIENRYDRSLQGFYGSVGLSFFSAGTFLFLSAFSLWGVWLVGATETVLQYQRHFWLGLSISFWPPAILWGLAAFALPYSFGTQAIILSLALFPFAATAYIVRQTIRRKPLWPIVLMTQ